MRIVSLNAWGGREWEALADWLPEIGADVLCLQEVIRAAEPSPDWLVYTDLVRTLDQRTDLYADVSRSLPNHEGRFVAAAQGSLRDAEGRDYRSEHGLGLWRRRDLAITGTEEGFVHGSYRADGWGPEPVPRRMQAVRFEGLVVAHFHGLRDPAGKGDMPARAAQARALRAGLDRLAQPGDRIVLGGDFNLLPGSETFDILAPLGLRDLVTGRGIEDTRTALYKKPQRHANYMLVTPNVEVLGFEVPATPILSDHRPLILDIAD